MLDLFQEGKIPIDHIISPEEEVASAIVKQWRTPGAFDVAEFCNSHVTMLGILCNSNCPILDTPLRELVELFPGLNATIMAIIRDNNLIIPRSGGDVLKINDKIRLIPGHCDPTCNLHDWYVVVKDKKVIDLWPVSARGFSF